MKKLLFCAAIIFVAGCSNPSAVKNTPNNKYILTINQEVYNEVKHSFDPKAKTEPLLSANDTTAYMDALKKWYDIKIEERKGLSYGLSKSFTIVDKNGIDLTIKLPQNIVMGINKQVENIPDVQKLIYDTNMDSLATP